ncbi:MAG: DUF4442 domain-containing protein [Bdellovibrio sp.]|nr:MAG: DUF4442 domain-containing protein [Bdellovibrio sp.]
MQRPHLKETLKILGFSALKIPLIAFLTPQVLELSKQRCKVKIPLNYRSKNHLGCMYFGALAVGADLSAGLLALQHVHLKNTQLLFKDFQAHFLKRAEGDVIFVCEEGNKIQQMVKTMKKEQKRVTSQLNAVALVPQKLGEEPVATFQLTLSLKDKN